MYTGLTRQRKVHTLSKWFLLRRYLSFKDYLVMIILASLFSLGCF